METLIVGAVIGVIVGYSMGREDTAKRKLLLDQQETALNKAKKALQEREEEIENSQELRESQIRRLHEEYSSLVTEAKACFDAFKAGMLNGRRWLARAYSEFVSQKDLEAEAWLVLKPNPAWKAADTVAELRKKHRKALYDAKLLQYQVDSYKEYFPALEDYEEAILDEIVDLRSDAIDALDKTEPALALGYLTTDEYEKLSTAEKFQLALERYLNKKWDNIGVGRHYERMIGYKYESTGWRVSYYGALKGLSDFGRDLVCTKDGLTHIVQCKCWARNKQIREKYIFQLHGTTLLYSLKNNSNRVVPVFASTVPLSQDAKMAAQSLKIEIRQDQLESFPMIKCNINSTTKEKIYHLPFDQQYDRVIIGDQPGEFFATTVAEAEAAGFRRALKWKGGAPADV